MLSLLNEVLQLKASDGEEHSITEPIPNTYPTDTPENLQ